MRTLTVDDRRSVVNMMLRILDKIDPEGEHIGTTDPEKALKVIREKEVTAVYVDVEMPKINGIELARMMQEVKPETNIIFITGYQEYMPDAFELYASGYLMKPVDEDDVRKSLEHLRYKGEPIKTSAVRVQCFGNFEVFVGNTPMLFHRSKSKELFAYLIDRKGAACTNDMIIGNLWGDEPLTESLKSLQRTVISEMIKEFEQANIEGLFSKSKDGISGNTDMVDCDYYKYLDGDEKAIRRFKGEYMTQYEFAEETRNNLLKNY